MSPQAASRAELETLCMIEMFCSKSQLFSVCVSSQLGMSCMWCGDQLPMARDWEEGSVHSVVCWGGYQHVVILKYNGF